MQILWKSPMIWRQASLGYISIGDRNVEMKTWKPETWKLENFENIKNDPWDMLNNFCFHVYAQKSLFIAENCNAFLGPQPPHPHLWV